MTSSVLNDSGLQLGVMKREPESSVTVDYDDGRVMCRPLTVCAITCPSEAEQF